MELERKRSNPGQQIHYNQSIDHQSLMPHGESKAAFAFHSSEPKHRISLLQSLALASLLLASASAQMLAMMAIPAACRSTGLSLQVSQC